MRTLRLILVLLALRTISWAAQDVLTYHNNAFRFGLNPNETTLTLANVKSSTFGKLFTIPVDGLVDAQPLYVSAINISSVRSW